MYRLGQLIDGEWIAHSHLPVFEVAERLIAGVPSGDPAVFEALIECLEPPYHLLYVLHTPRGEAMAGRYQSPSISFAQVRAFLGKFGTFLSSDSRYDIWAHSPTENGTIVWDRHNQLFGYGPLKKYSSKLVSIGFNSGQIEIPTPHQHYYHSAFDQCAKEVICAFDWSYSPLQPEDEQ